MNLIPEMDKRPFFVQIERMVKDERRISHGLDWTFNINSLNHKDVVCLSLSEFLVSSMSDPSPRVNLVLDFSKSQSNFHDGRKAAK